MSVTLEELKQRMAERTDPEILLERLDISSAELIERFEDKIDERFDSLCGEYWSDEDEEVESSES